MATIRAYTTIEQSRKLAEILPLESADMVYFGIYQGIDGKYHLSGTNTEDDVIPIYKNLCTKVFTKTTTSDIICMLPCWSLSALLDVLPNGNMLVKTTEGGYYCLSKYSMTKHYNNPIDACYEMILKLHELNLL